MMHLIKVQSANRFIKVVPSPSVEEVVPEDEFSLLRDLQLGDHLLVLDVYHVDLVLVLPAVRKQVLLGLTHAHYVVGLLVALVVFLSLDLGAEDLVSKVCD